MWFETSLAAPQQIEIISHPDYWVTLGTPLLAAAVTLVGTLAGVRWTQRGQRDIARYSAIRKEKLEQILNFLDAAIAVQHALQKRFYGKQAEGAGALMPQLWLREKGVFLVCGKPVRDAAKEYAKKLA